MERVSAKKIVKKYSEKLKKENFDFKEIYLFGSFAKGKQHKWSDIDIAVVSDEFKRNSFKKSLRLWDMREGIDDRIEPHWFTVKDFSIDWDPMVHEIKTTGIKIA